MITKIIDIISRNKQKPRLLIDELKFYFQSITNFFDYMLQPLVSKIKPFRGIDTPHSSKYNKFIDSIENDINLIHGIQDEISDNMLASWNVVENSYPTDIAPVSPYDENFILEYDNASVISDRITLGVKSFVSVLDKIKGVPIMSAVCSDKNTPVYYGKAWGAYVPGDESGEDGIRVENNDGSLIVDGKDTFWESEAVILQESRPNTVFLQSIQESDVSLSTTPSPVT